MISQQIQGMVDFFSIDIVMGWSIMDIFFLTVVLFLISGLVNYMLSKAGS